MRPTDPAERIPVRVKYVPRGYGLALTICDEATLEDSAVGDGQPAGSGDDDGYLTVVESGVTTLELRQADGGSSYLIWDQSEVAWDSLQAG